MTWINFKVRRIIVCLQIILLLLLSGFSAFSIEKKKVFVLHSYHQGLEWADSISKGFQSIFAPLEDEVEVYYEYLDTKRVPGDAYVQHFKSLYEYKLREMNFDVLIVADNNAFNFVLEYQGTLFKNIPIVFCGISNLNPSQLIEKKNITGVVENPDIEGTLRLMRQMHPLRKKILVVNDKTTTGIANKRIFQNVSPRVGEDLEIEYYDDFSEEHLLHKLQELSGEWMVYLLSLNRDINQRYYSYTDAIHLVSQNTKVPVYGSWDFYMNKGIVGGVITNGFEQGKTAALMAQQILKGVVADSIPINWVCPTRVIFDYERLTVYGIDPDKLPDEAFLINRPPSFLKSHYRELFLGFCFSLLVILFLVITMQLRRKQRIKLKALNKSLDRRVEMRTRQLEELNKSLVQKNDEISNNVEKLERQEELTRLAYLRLKAILNNSLVGILAVDSHRNVIDANLCFCEIMGCSMDELIGKSVKDFYKTEYDYEEFGEAYLEKLDDEKQVSIEHQLKRKNGQMIWCRLHGSALDLSELVHGYIWVVDDITERKQASLKLEESEKALRLANATKDRFFSIIAHDLKNPVNAILGLSKFLSQESEEVDETTRKEFTADLYTASMNMQALLEDLLTWGRLQINGVSFRLERLDIKDLTDQAIKAVSNMAKSKGIILQNQIRESCWVRADSNMIITVIRNLLNNAIKFTNPGGGVQISVKTVDGRVEVSVCDSGIGISSKDLPHLFDMGRKIQYPGTQQEAGTGLGLLLCKEFVLKNGGEIWAKSEQGKGSCFQFSLSLAE